MNKLRDNVILWAVLIALITAGRAAFAWGWFFTYFDLVFIACAMLVFRGRVYTAYGAACFAGALADLITMPYFGYHFFSYAFGISALWALTINMYRENYLTKVFIVAAGMSLMWAFYALLVFVFHWGFKLKYLSWQALPQVFFTTLAAAAVFKAVEFYDERLSGWLRTTLRKT